MNNKKSKTSTFEKLTHSSKIDVINVTIYQKFLKFKYFKFFQKFISFYDYFAFTQ
jgi:hypothetical protein